MQQFLLKGKTALISGAARNMGKEIALTFAREGADLILLSRTLSDLNQVAKECESLGVRALPLVADVTKPEEVNRSVQQGLKQFGKIDVLVNVIGARPKKPLLEIELDEWKSVFDVNCHALFHLAKAVIPGMMERKSGSIVAVGGQSSLRPSKTGAMQTSSKHAGAGLVKSLALEFGPHGIRANMVLPGFTNVEQHIKPEWHSAAFQGEEAQKTAMKRIAQPHEIANAVLFLASDLSSFITGDRMLVCGGAVIV